jgi:photosystem II stability/assembly factor-like uncharacterized protein
MYSRNHDRLNLMISFGNSIVFSPKYLLILISIFCLTIARPTFAQTLDIEKLHGLKPRAIGPAGMSGRVTAIDVVLSNPDIIYVGTASGGLWKSTSAGVAWKPIFDEQKVASIGDVAVVQCNPDVIWIGTGEGNPRNSQTNGNGVYKSLNGGKTWQHLGLDNTRSIHRLIVHPDNPDIVYVAAMGSAWGENPERGIYKTTDAGKTWQKILYVDDKTGAADLVMDPSNPNKLIAAMWQYRRWPWFFKSGGSGSGLYVTYDGGETWQRRTSKDGLPKGDLGRIGIAIAPSDPKIIYALIESKKNALYRSEDGGYKWKKVSDKNIGNRPFYYAEIYVDPKNENRIYNLYSVVTVSEDGGKTFETILPYARVHPDHHAWWIHPQDADFIIDGNDGGLAISKDRGKTWRFVENLPLAQFYHINFDMEFPYNVYGGMQDNGSWRGPSYVWRYGGIRNTYWEEVCFGDGFDVVPDQSDPKYVYAMSQGGNLRRYDLETGQQKFIRPIHPDNIPLRFNWNAGIAHDPFNKTTIYYGSQFLHKSNDCGDSWEIISPDLTTNDPEKQKQLESGGLTFDVTDAENFTTIISIVASPVKEGVIWVGTDDGNVQITQDGGKTWTNVVNNIKGVPKGTWVPQITASTYNAGGAFVVFDNHRRNDWTPYVYHTNNFGKSWKRLADENKVWGYALAIAQDPIESKLLLLGTEFGLYVSIDGGENWSKWKEGFPTVSTMDLLIHPRENDLVIGTFGRSAYILDDIQPLRVLAQNGPATLDQKLRLFKIPDAYQVVYKRASGTRFAAEAEFSGENKPYGALISFIFNPKNEKAKEAGDKKTKDSSEVGTETEKDSIQIEILNGAGQVIRSFKVAAKAGLNRCTWELERKGVRRPSRPKPKPNTPEPQGAKVLPGKYLVRIVYEDEKDSTWVNVIIDPRISTSEADIQSREQMIKQSMELTQIATDAADRLREAKKTIQLISSRIKEREDEVANKIKEKGKAIQDSLKTLLELINPREVQGIRRDPTIISSRMRLTTSYIQSSYDAPGQMANLSFKQAKESLQEALLKINDFFSKEWAEYQNLVEDSGLSFFESYQPFELQ